MTTFFAIMLGSYFLLLIVLSIGWRKAFRQSLDDLGVKNSVTVLVPFRNEEGNLKPLANAFSRINYPKDKWEVVFINDHSTDNSVVIVESLVRENSNYKLFNLNEQKEGKKHALTLGVSMAQGEIILTTDADCLVPANWLEGMNKVFLEPEVQMAFGGVRLNSNGSFFSKLQAVEFVSLISSGVATLGLGFFSMCNGANLGFRKSAFQSINGYEGNMRVASGDDEFLARKILKKFPDSLRFVTEPNMIVATGPQATLKEFINQRLRWAGKWRFNTSASSKLLAGFVLLTQITFILLFACFFAGLVPGWLLLTLISVKVALEFCLLFPANRFLESRWSWLSFFCLQFIYPLYVIAIGFGSLWMGYEWKGRRMSHKM